MAADREDTNHCSLFLIAIVGNLGSLLFGYDFGVTSWLLVSVANYAASTSDPGDGTNYYIVVNDSSGLRGLIAAGASIGAFITYVVLLFFGNALLKKDEIMLSACLFFSGALLESTSGILDWNGSWNGLAVLIAGRIIYGAGIASSFHAVPQYISELGPKNLRGMVGTVTEAMITTGVILGFLIGFLYEEGGWVVPFRVGYCIAIAMGFLALFIPHSPSGMVTAGYDVPDVLEAYRVIHTHATEEDIHDLLARREEEKIEFQRWERYFQRVLSSRGTLGTDMEQTPPEDKPCCDVSLEVKVLFSDPRMRRCLMLAILLVILQIGTGQGVILYFSGDIFLELCPDTYDECLLAFGGVKLVSAYMMVFFADSLGRREFLCWGTSIMVAGMIILTAAYNYKRMEIALSGLFIAVAGYEAGLGSFMWVLLSEIFPRFTRSASNSIAVSVLFLVSTILTFSLPYFLEFAGLLPIFILFTVIGGAAILALYLYAPETSGVELEEAYKGVEIRCRQAGLGLCCGNDEDEDHDQQLKALEGKEGEALLGGQQWPSSSHRETD